ncbi:hypothetical protein QQS21_001280 [Conoideocrella luteorostrata]|uniref:Uncharacterized protein n=1 Tax=Conoideocrella luteorostrata TaxID=1105319 RepID=A0AAJ0CY50_9HYPO|nr:hypothetical protein QQS21_001280 [Conoideocrella luteorostrata]
MITTFDENKEKSLDTLGTADGSEPAKGPSAKEPAQHILEQDHSQYLKGWKLFLVMSGITVVLLLAMLDISIVGTCYGSATHWQNLHLFQHKVYTGVAMGVGQIGVVLGPLLGGVLTEHASWRWCFYINLPLGGLAGLFLILIHIPDQTPKERLTFRHVRTVYPKFDLVGFALFAPASIMLLLALSFGAGDYKWNSSQVIGLFCGAGVTAIVFVLWEHRMGNDAMIPLPMVRQRVVWASAMNFSLLMMSIIVGSTFMPIYLQSVKGLSPTMSGVYLLASIGPQIVFVIISGALVGKLGYYITWALFASAMTTIACGLITLWNPETSLGPIIGYQILLGARGAGMQMGVIAIQTALPPKMAAVGNSFIVFSQNFLGAILITIANIIFQETLRAKIAANIPGISSEAAIAAGGSAEAVRALASSGEQLQRLLEAYSTGFRNVFYMLTGIVALAFMASFGMGWVDLRKKVPPKKV